jgi:hypothetical protein
MLCAALGDHGLDPACPELATILVVVVAAVGDELLSALARTTGLPAHRTDLVNEREQLSDVVAVAARQADGKRDAVAVDDQMVL